MFKTTLALSAACGLVAAAAQAAPPPLYVELSPQLIQSAGFKYHIYQRDTSSGITLEFPAEIDQQLVPHATRIVTRDLQGRRLQDSMNWTSKDFLRIVSWFNHHAVDTSVSVTYCDKEHGGSCKEFGISSVSDFIRNNAKPGDILPDQPAPGF